MSVVDKRAGTSARSCLGTEPTKLLVVPDLECAKIFLCEVVGAALVE
jgi:hypothetical protein